MIKNTAEKMRVSTILTCLGGVGGESSINGKETTPASSPGPMMRKMAHIPTESTINPKAIKADLLRSFEDLGEKARYIVNPRSPAERIASTTIISTYYHK
jgi:hypothetical protein